METLNKPIIVEQTFLHCTKKVWDAITLPDQMNHWYFDNIPSFEAVVGFQTEFNVTSNDRNFKHLWKILEVEPLKKIKYRWRFAEYPGDSFVTFELFEMNSTTLLRLTNEGLESFPRDIPEFTSESCQAGWRKM